MCTAVNYGLSILFWLSTFPIQNTPQTKPKKTYNMQSNWQYLGWPLRTTFHFNLLTVVHNLIWTYQFLILEHVLWLAEYSPLSHGNPDDVHPYLIKTTPEIQLKSVILLVWKLRKKKWKVIHTILLRFTFNQHANRTAH